MVICPDCGKEVPAAKFCKNCGASLSNVNEETQVVNVEETSIETKVSDSPVVIETTAHEVNEDDIEVEADRKSGYCFNCGHELNGDFKFCPNCGCDLENKTRINRRSSSDVVTSSEEKNILISIILSIFIPGLGHFYLGLSRKGAIFLFAYVISAVLILLLIGLLLVLVVWIWALVDVIQSTNAINRGESVEDKLF